MAAGLPDLQSTFIRLELMDASHRELMRDPDLVEAMWMWAPVLSPGTNLDSYFEDTIKRRAAGNYFPFVVFTQDRNDFAGVVSYSEVSRTHRRARVDYIWHPPQLRGTIIGPATQLEVLNLAIASRTRRIEFMGSEDQIRRLKSIERMGARREGVLRQYWRIAGGGWGDIILYSLVGDEIPVAVQALKDRLLTASAP